MAMSNAAIAASLRTLERQTSKLYGVGIPGKAQRSRPGDSITIKRTASRPPRMPSSMPASD